MRLIAPEHLTFQTGQTYPGQVALNDVREIYNKYESSSDEIELVAMLSAVVRGKYPKGKILSADMFDKRYVATRPTTSTGLHRQLTQKGLAAVNLVNAETDGSDIEMWLEEPFIGFPVVSRLPADRKSSGYVALGDAHRQLGGFIN